MYGYKKINPITLLILILIDNSLELIVRIPAKESGNYFKV